MFSRFASLLRPAAAASARKAPFRMPVANLGTYEDKSPVTVTVTGAAGSIGYALLFRIASGQMLGEDQPINLRLLELPAAKNALDGVVMELHDCAFPLVEDIVATSDVNEAFEGTDFALLVGARPRTKGMERGDLLEANGKIFKEQGQALNQHSNQATVKILVVGNPANTNALIAASYAPNIHPTQFTAMTRLDHNRGLAQLALKTESNVADIERFAIWGNHSATQYPDISHTLIDGEWAPKLINDEQWVRETFIPTVQKRGAAIIEARGASSAASAASAAIDHMRDWVFGTDELWTSMAVWSDGTKYGTTPGVYFSYPVVCSEGKYTIVGNVPIDPFSAERIEISNKELAEERDAVRKLMPDMLDRI